MHILIFSLSLVHYLKIIQVIRHERLNLPSQQCEPDPDYNFAHCVDTSVMKSAGCQPPWRSVNVGDLPICDNPSLLRNYTVNYATAMDLIREAFETMNAFNTNLSMFYNFW